MGLKKEVGLLELTLAGIGVILGAGIYVLVGKAAGIAGDYIWVSFAAAGLIAILTGLSYAELSARFPKAGAEYVYGKSAFGKKWAFGIGFALLLVGIASSATVALGFGGYFSAIFHLPSIIGTMLILLLSFAVIWFGAKISTSIAGLLSIVEIGGLLAIIFIGIPTISNGFPIPNFVIVPGILSAAALIFFAFLGFEDLVRLSEDTKNSQKIMPIALLLAIVISTILYILVAASAVSILGGEALGQSHAPLAEVAARGFGGDAFWVLAIVALFSTGNTVLLLLLATSRLVYGLSSEKTLPRILGETHHSQPRNALIISTIGVGLLVLYQDIMFVAHVTDGLLFAVFAIMNAAIIKISLDDKKTFTGFKIPLRWGKIPIPAVVGSILNAGMLFFVEVNALLFGIAFVFVGMLGYYVWKQNE
ncbi:MAG: APC family permease [Candidatus Diapherotrites archaeon]